MVDPETQTDGLEGEAPVSRFQLDCAFVPVSTLHHQIELPSPWTAKYMVEPET
jgi:hypothetical protein